MNKSKLQILDISPSQVQTGSFTIVLAEEKGDLRLPIIIGMFEAQAIAIEIEKIKSSRPLTHDLFSSFAQAFDFTIEEINITDISEGIFYAKIVCSDGIRQKSIDARPSDAIAIALRFDAPIYVFPHVLEEAGVSTAELMGEERKSSDTEGTSIPVSDKKKKKPLSKLNISELQQKLNDALEKEDYEQAAKIRDEIDRRN
ncbi:DUF151 domain-containing protein [Marinilongibacter aquaticus]|uniref:bifunctional nuclease family protein n=1 Tax=Marinilongibacter aquaticus TaxID=2975157 RepID=UPI0021BD255F|nr:bifunctional nuclease family protein [Marinilongibacter aquaticus]UBM59318.1 DUF151 domain-containing protein [Marinilongibacter aquaticus]